MNDLDLAPIEARVAADLAGAGVPLLDHYQHDIPALLAEVRRLRADRDHARGWAATWHENALGDLTDDLPADPPRTASDGWDGGNASFAAPDGEETS